jgi:hypothetical protein
MKSERKISLILSGMLISISFLLIARSPPRIAEWQSSLSTFVEDLVLLVVPVLGVAAGTEFVRKDERGWAGILFHLVMFYTAIGYSIVATVDITTIAQQGGAIITGIIDCILAALGWFGFLLYYD